MFVRRITIYFFIFISFFTLITSKITIDTHVAERKLSLIAMRTYSIYCGDAKTALLINYGNNKVCDEFLKHAGVFGHSMSIFTYDLMNNASYQGTVDGGKADLTMIFLDSCNISKIDSVWKEISEVPLYQSFSKYLLVFSTKPPKNYLKVIENLFKFLWSKKILRVFLVFSIDHIKIYSFDPFKNDFCKDITDWSEKKKKDALEFELFDLNGYFMNTFILDDEGYKERITEKINDNGGIEYVGYDGKLLTQVRNILNVSLNIIRESNFHIYEKYRPRKENDKYQLFMVEQNIDICFTAIRAKSNSNMDNIFLHERDDFVIVLPKAEKIPEYLYIFLLLPIRFVCATLMSAFLVSIALYILRCTKHFWNNQYVESLFDVYKIMFNVPLTRHNNNYQERLILSTWMLFSIMFSVAFNCTLVSALVVSKYYPDINKIDDLAKTNTTIWTTPYDYQLVKAALTGNDVKLLKKLVINNDVNFLNSIYSFQNDSGFLLRYERAREFMKVTKKIGKTRYNIMSEHPLPNAQSYLMPRGHPYMEEIQWIVHKVHESGLWYEWRKTDYGRENITTATDLQTVFDEGYMYLKLYHLQSLFYLLNFGHFIAFLVFCAEYLTQTTNVFNKRIKRRPLREHKKLSLSK